MQHVIKNIIFDWGGVQIDITMEHFIHFCQQIKIKFSETEVNSTHKAGFFLEYEKGYLSDNEFRKEFRSRTEMKLSDERIDYIWNSMLGKIPTEKLQLLKTLQNKYNLFLLSNTNPIHWNTFITKSNSEGLKFEELFKKIYLSYELHAMKPDTLIFDKTIMDADINVKETLFIDDSLVNCQTAQKLGMHILNYKPGNDLASCIFENRIL